MPATYNIYDPAADIVDENKTSMSFGGYFNRSKSSRPAKPVTRNMKPNAAKPAPNKYNNKAEKIAAKKARRKAAKANAAKGNTANTSAPNRSTKPVADILQLPFDNNDKQRSQHDFGKMLKHIRGLAIRDETMQKKFGAIISSGVQGPKTKGHKEYEHYVAEVTTASAELRKELIKKPSPTAKTMPLYGIGHSGKMGWKQISRKVTTVMFDMAVYKFVLLKIYSKINKNNKKMKQDSLSKKTSAFDEYIQNYMAALNKYIATRKKSDADLLKRLNTVGVSGIPNLNIGSELLDWSATGIDSNTFSNNYDVNIDID